MAIVKDDRASRVGAGGKEIAFKDNGDEDKRAKGFVIIDEDGAQTGTTANPLAVDGTINVDFVEFTDMEGGGDVTIGTSQVEVTFTGTTQIIHVQADVDNTGIIFLGKTGVLSNKTNDFVRLFAGDEITMPYNDATNALFAISDTSSQTINKGTLL